MFRARSLLAAAGAISAVGAISFAAAVGFALPVSAQTPSAAGATAPAKVDLQRGAEIARDVCSACHGPDGNSELPDNPRLASQHAGYLVKQLNDFRVQEGAEQAQRVSAIMAGFAAMLTPEDIRNVSAHFAAQKLNPAAPTDRELAERGRAIYRVGIAAKGVPACSSCHGPNGAGIPVEFPRVQGQFPEYHEAQLVAFRQGERGNSAQMRTIAERLSDKEIKAVSAYMAGLR